MYYFSLVAAALAVVAGAVRIDIPASGLAPIEGQPIEIFYSEATAPVTITLKNGPSDDLQDVQVIGDGPAGAGSITWTPDGLPSGMYALEITDGTGVNYSPQFSYQGSGEVITDNDTATPTATDAPPTGTDAVTTPATFTSPTNTTMNTTTTAATTTDETTSPMDDATTTADDATATEPPPNKANSRLGSSMALVLGAAVLLFTFN